MKNDIDLLYDLEADLKKTSEQNGVIGFLSQEMLRFRTIAGTLANINFLLNKEITVDERYITHILVRSLLENLIRILYIFDDKTDISARYEACLNGFKEDYRKLHNDLDHSIDKLKKMQKKEDKTVAAYCQLYINTIHQIKTKIEPSNDKWKNLKPAFPCIADCVNGLKFQDTNEEENAYKLKCEIFLLYSYYRVMSFDVHGNNLVSLFRDVFQKECNFTNIDVKEAFKLIANFYRYLWKNKKK